LDQAWPTLAAAAYSDPAIFAAERREIFLKTWQLVGHACDLPNPGDYLVFDLLDQSAILIRGEDGAIRAFHNACRHRAFRLLEGEGCSPARVRCRYHGFSYALDGHLAGVPGERDFVGLDKAAMGLRAVELESWQGFLFIRFQPDAGPSVAQQLDPLSAHLARYRFPELRPFGRETRDSVACNWKVAQENNIEGYHIPVGHPGLQRLFGERYGFAVLEHGVSRAGGPLPDSLEGLSWSERHYLSLLPAECERAWGYVSLFPNVAFDLYPDQVDFFQIIPLAPDRTLLRSRGYALPDDRREMRAARYCNMRINRLVSREDRGLVEGVQRGLASLGYGEGLLHRREARVRQHQEGVRARLAVPRSAETTQRAT
jgi:phenylpropionate dioxygenase-like ring-hydroxylating dioxygenase large terminal subunit